jgi:hypothetical protein
MRRFYLFFGIAAFVMMVRCGDNAISIGDPPPSPVFSMDQSNPNNVIFKVESAKGFMVNWDFGNGTLSQNSIDTIYFPFADTYTVKLTASNKGGATTTQEKLIIATTDPKICSNKYYELLSGGCNVASKTWKLYSGDGAYGNGPPSSKDSLGNGTSSYNDQISYWWNSSTATKPPVPDSRSLDDEYIFGLRGFTYKNDCYGTFYFNWKWANKLFGLSQATYADTICSYNPNNPATWTLDMDTVTPEDMTAKDSTSWKRRYFTDSATGKRFNLILTLSNSNYIGYGSGTSIYQIVSITQDTMYLRSELLEPDKPSVTGPNRLEWRYSRYIAKK